MPKAGRLALAIFIFVLAFGLGVLGVAAYLRIQPPNVNFTSGHRPGQPVDLTAQTVGTFGSGVHAAWVSYLVKAPDGRWVHSTQWVLPAHTRVNMTIYEYDGGTPLRNPVWGRVSGVYGNSYTLNGTKKVHLLESTAAKTQVAHTFTVPAMGINVPLYAVPSSKLCPAAPCTLKEPHETIQFSFYTGHPGQYRWQCFIPCGLSYLDGNGGPMDTLGYMAGFLKVI